MRNSVKLSTWESVVLQELLVSAIARDEEFLTACRRERKAGGAYELTEQIKFWQNHKARLMQLQQKLSTSGKEGTVG